jgi:Ca2+-binding EF-hand superfamily protein
MYPNRNEPYSNKVKHIALEGKIDDLERRLIEKVEVSSGFAETLKQSRKMRQSLQFFDTAGSGFLNYSTFFQAMTQFNLVGVQREVEALFNRYDDYLTG